MMPKKSIYILIAILIAMAFITVGCERSYTSLNESQATPTIAEFPGGTLAVGMGDVVNMGAQTATANAASDASLVIPTAGDGTPVPPTAPTTVSDNPAQPTADPINPTAVPATPVESPTNGKPSSYVLKQGEFPYCLARRFNVDPSELLNLNGLSDVQARQLQPGLSLAIPQTGKAFPSDRWLNYHPTSYTVPHAMSVYAIACYFGDVSPAEITNANTIPDINNIAANTILTIP